LYAYNQNVMQCSAYRGRHIDRMRYLNATFYALFLERVVVETLEKEAAECCRIFGFDSKSRQFIFNALS